MQRHAWTIFVAAGAAAVVTYMLLPPGWWQASAGVVIGLSAAGAVVVGTRVQRSHRRLPWWFLAAGLVLETAGDLVYAIYEELSPEGAPFPSWADAAYLLGVPMITVALVLLVRARTGRDRAAVIDATIVVSGVGLLSWVFLMEPLAYSSDLSLSGRLVSLAYPLADLLFLALIVRLLAGAGSRVPAIRLLAAALAVWLVMDTAYAVLLQYSAYSLDHVINVFWLTGFVLFGAAALHPSIAELTERAAQPAGRLTRTRLAVLTAVSLIAPVLLLYEAVFERGAVDGVAIGVASGLLFLLVLARMKGLLRQVEYQAEQLSVLARNDGLTGVPNRRAWDGELPVALDRARRDGSPLSVAMLDLDHFKLFNDQYGHQAGDRLLRTAAAAWGAELRTTDLLCRYGGEEFGVLLPGADGDEAYAVIERVRAATPLAQTVSAGIATWDRQEDSEVLVSRADRALYRAKDDGRDRIRMVQTQHQRGAMA